MLVASVAPGGKHMTCERTRRRVFVILALIASTLVNIKAVTAQSAETLTKYPIKVQGVSGKLGLYNTITVEVENLSNYLKQSGRDGQKFILYLDWRPLKGINSRLVEGADKLQFDIKRTPDADTKAAWD